MEPISERVVHQLNLKDDAKIVSPLSNLSSKGGFLLSTPESEGAGLQWMPLTEGDQVCYPAPFHCDDSSFLILVQGAGSVVRRARCQRSSLFVQPARTTT